SQTRLHDQIDIEREYLESPSEIRTREELEDAGADIADQRFSRPEGGSRGIADDRPAWMAQSIEDPDTRLRPQEEGEGGFLYETARRLSQRSVTKQRAGDDAGTVAAGDIAAADNAAFETDPALARRSRAAIQEEIGQGVGLDDTDVKALRIGKDSRQQIVRGYEAQRPVGEAETSIRAHLATFDEASALARPGRQPVDASTLSSDGAVMPHPSDAERLGHLVPNLERTGDVPYRDVQLARLVGGQSPGEMRQLWHNWANIIEDFRDRGLIQPSTSREDAGPFDMAYGQIALEIAYAKTFGTMQGLPRYVLKNRDYANPNSWNIHTAIEAIVMGTENDL